MTPPWRACGSCSGFRDFTAKRRARLSVVGRGHRLTTTIAWSFRNRWSDRLSISRHPPCSNARRLVSKTAEGRAETCTLQALASRSPTPLARKNSRFRRKIASFHSVARTLRGPPRRLPALPRRAERRPSLDPAYVKPPGLALSCQFRRAGRRGNGTDTFPGSRTQTPP